MKQLFAIVAYYMFGYLIFWTLLHETSLFPKIWVQENFNIAIYVWIFFFIIPLMLIALGNDYIKNRISDFKLLNQNTRWSLYLLLFGVWDLMIGFAYLLFSYFEITQVTMIVANALFITGTYLTFLSFSIAKRLQNKRGERY